MYETIAIPISKLDELKSDFRQLGTYLFSFFSGNEIAYLDLKDLLLEQIFADIYYKDYPGKTFNARNEREFNARINEVIEQFKRLPPGGAYIRYPKQLHAKERKKVVLEVSRDKHERKTIENINDFLREYLGEPIQLDYLEANLEASDPTTIIFPRANKYQYFRLSMSALEWSWLITPNHDGELILNILLFRRSNMNTLSELKDTAWPSFLTPSVAINVLPEQLSLSGRLNKICVNPVFLATLAIIGIILTLI